MANKTQTARVTVTMDTQQAERQLQVLNDKAGELKTEINSLKALKLQNIATPEDLSRLRELEQAYRQVRKDAKELKDQLGDVRGVIDKISSAPIKAIRDALKKATAQMERMDRSTKAFVEKKKEVALLRSELNKISSAGNKTSGMFGNMGKSFKAFATSLIAFKISEILGEGLRYMTKFNVELSDQLSDIEKATGITGEALGNLSEQILHINTRTSVEQLNNLAVAAGKLGISAEEDVLGFVRAGNIINVALGEDLGEDAIKNLAKLNDILGVTKELGVENALLATGSAINELGQSSTASEGYLVDFAQRLGGIASQAGLTIQQVLALGSAADQMGQNVEVSATALNKVITTLVSKTGQVAKAIGVTEKELRAALDKSTWDGLMLVFEKLSGKGGLAGIAPLMGDLGSDGARLNAVISALTSDMSRLTQELKISNEAFAKGTSVIDEYDKKNNNLAGTIEKIKKNLQGYLMGSKFVNWMNKIAIGIEEITRASDSLNVKLKEQTGNFVRLSINMPQLIDEYNRLKDSKVADEQERLKQVISDIVKVVPGAVTEFDKYGNAVAISTSRVEEFISAQKSQLQQLNKQAIDETEKELKRAQRKMKVLEVQQKEVAKTGTFTIQNPVTYGAMPSYRKASGSEVAELSKEYEKQQAIISKLSENLSVLKGDYIEDAIIAEQTARHKARIEKEYEDQRRAEEQKKVQFQQESEKERNDRIKNEQESIDRWLQQRRNALLEARLAEQDSNSESYISQEEYNKAIEALELQGLQKRLAIIGLEPKEIEKIQGQILEVRQKMVDEILKAQREAEKEAEKVLLAANPLKKEEIEYDERLKAIGVFGKKREELTKEQYEALQLLEEQHENKITDIEAKSTRERLRRTEDLYRRRFDEERFKRDMDIQKEEGELNKLGNMGLSSDALYERQMDLQAEKIKLLYDELHVRESVGAETTNILKKISDEENRTMDLAAQNFRSKSELYKQYGAQIGDAFGQMFTSQEEGLRALGDATIDILFDVLEKIVTTKLIEVAATGVSATGKATAEAYATPDAVLTGGITAVPRIALMSGLIAAAIAAAKAGLKALINGGKSGNTSSVSQSGQRVVKTGFSVGGDTGDGPVEEIAGVVHRKEYVVPAWQMKDPVSFNYVRALETIRQTRSHENKLKTRFMGYETGGPVQTSVPLVPMGTDPEMKAMLKEMGTLLNYLKSNPFRIDFSVAKLKETQTRMENSRLRGSLKK